MLLPYRLDIIAFIMSDRQQEQVDQEEFQPSNAPETTQPQDEGTTGADEPSLDQDANNLDTENIIDDNQGPGGRSLRGNRGDPLAAVSTKIQVMIKCLLLYQDKQIDAEVDSAETVDS